MDAESALTPYRVNVFARGFRPVGKPSKKNGYTKIALSEYGFQLWTEVQAYREARLPSAGSFLFPGLHAVRQAALDALAKPNVYQVQIKTNQDRTVYLWNKHRDGRVTGYGYTRQEWQSEFR
jgi:hypothetical protein